MKEERYIITMDGQAISPLPSDRRNAMTEWGNLRTVQGYRPDGSGGIKALCKKREFLSVYDTHAVSAYRTDTARRFTTSKR